MSTLGVSLRDLPVVDHVPAHLVACLVRGASLHLTVCDEHGRTCSLELELDDMEHLRKVLNDAQ